MNLQIGAQLYSVRDKTENKGDFLSALKALKAMGYNICQISGQSPEIPFALIRDLLDEAGLEPAATHISFEEMQRDLDAVIRDHKLLKCAYPGIGGLPEKYKASADGYIAFAKEAGAIAEKLLDHGMHFLYHNHNFEFTHFKDAGKTGLELIVENSPSALQFEIDVFWVQCAGANPIDWIERVAGRMDVIHFKEMGYAPGTTVKMEPIGEGNMNWKAIMAACEKAKVKYAFIEQDNAVDGDSLDCMRVSFENLTRLGGRF